MNGLEQTFYIMAIIYFSIMFLMMIAGIVAVFAIKKKIDNIHRQIDEKLAFVNNVIHTGGKIAQVAKNLVGYRKSS
ncbi:MAG TPA: hypothetical protein VJ836_04325 [Candidatus Saccharimonadales bacterium]|nr:hypothetical protein [Candidatus Saccharimonadales bacterium]